MGDQINLIVLAALVQLNLFGKLFLKDRDLRPLSFRNNFHWLLDLVVGLPPTTKLHPMGVPGANSSALTVLRLHEVVTR